MQADFFKPSYCGLGAANVSQIFKLALHLEKASQCLAIDVTDHGVSRSLPKNASYTLCRGGSQFRKFGTSLCMPQMTTSQQCELAILALSCQFGSSLRACNIPVGIVLQKLPVSRAPSVVECFRTSQHPDEHPDQAYAQVPPPVQIPNMEADDCVCKCRQNRHSAQIVVVVVPQLPVCHLSAVNVGKWCGQTCLYKSSRTNVSCTKNCTSSSIARLHTKQQNGNTHFFKGEDTQELQHRAAQSRPCSPNIL